MAKETLDELIPKYALNKSEFDSYKKLCDAENAQIKEIMLSENIEEATSGGYTAKVVVQNRESMNEEKLLEIAHHHGISEIIKTKEYIDFDALENAIYKGLIKQEIILEMDNAKEVKEVVTLRITKVKKKRGEE